MEKELKRTRNQREAEELQYTIRSSFFYRKRQQYKTILNKIRRIRDPELNWEPLSDLGISQRAWARILEKKIRPSQVFCNPEVIAAEPDLIAYYRWVAILSQKGVQRLAFGINALEESKGRGLSLHKAITLSALFNKYVSVVVQSDPKFSVRDIQLAAAMNFGTQINGSWRNEIGNEGARRVKELLLTYLFDEGLVTTWYTKAGHELSGGKQPPPIDSVKSLVLKNSYTVAFGSEPDISALNPDGVLEVAIEVKAGLDPAGALERYGAAKKSFDGALRQNKSATTIYLASCITPGVRKAIAGDRLVRKEFNLTDIFINHDYRQDFLEHIKWLLHL
jgi:hypothetical protein